MGRIQGLVEVTVSFDPVRSCVGGAGPSQEYLRSVDYPFTIASTVLFSHGAT